MNRFTRQEAKDIRPIIERALEIAAKESGYKISMGSISFGIDMTAKIEISKVAENEHGEFKQTRESQNFLEECEAIGIKPEALNAPIPYQGGTIRIVGYNRRAPKNAIQLSKDGENQGLRCPVRTIKQILRTTKPELLNEEEIAR